MTLHRVVFRSAVHIRGLLLKLTCETKRILTTCCFFLTFFTRSKRFLYRFINPSTSSRFLLPPYFIHTAEWSSWLPLYGNLCCRLVAQPACMTQTMTTGYLSQKVRLLPLSSAFARQLVPGLTLCSSYGRLQLNVEGMYRCCSLYCALSSGLLSCYFTPEEIDAKVEPTLQVPVNRVRRNHLSTFINHTVTQKSHGDFTV